MITDACQALPKDTPFAIKICVYEDERKVADHWESEVKVLQAMNELNREHIVRFITAFRRPREHGGSEHYMIIEWADGGNLRSMWKRNPVPNLTVALIKDAMFQILGLATALEAAHSLNVNGVSYCHGDLKPENILCFDNGRTIGTLKIGDWGQAKEHRSMTEMRPSEVAEAFGTRLYEPPEAETGIIFRLPGQSTRRHSRLYDIWAMGCITLEFIIWLLRGWEGLVQFHSDIGERTFYEIIVSNGRREAQLHSAAKSWMDSMANDPRCQVGSTALGDLLELVRTALLVVKLPRRPGKVWKDRLEVFRTDSVSNLGPEVGGSGVKNGPFRIEETPHSPPELPTFTITPADPEPERDPILPELEKSRPVRCLATDFRSQMEHIVAEDPDEAEGYWLAYQSQSLEVRAT
jgi:serine/threonine protein kinase